MAYMETIYSDNAVVSSFNVFYAQNITIQQVLTETNLEKIEKLKKNPQKSKNKGAPALVFLDFGAQIVAVY